MSDAIPFNSAATQSTLFAALRAAALRHGASKVILEDVERQPLTYGRLILASLVLGRRLKSETEPGQITGLLLPNVNALVVALFGLNAYGRTVAFLNFTAGSRNIRRACHPRTARRRRRGRMGLKV